MGLIQLALFGLVAVVLKVSHAQCLTSCRMRSYVPTRTFIACPQETCCAPSGTEDLNKLILLAKLLIEKNSNNNNAINAESIIKKLIDALIYTTLQYNQCRATLDLLIRGGKCTKGNGSTGVGGNSLIDLDLLNPNSPNNVLDLGVVGQSVLGVGLGNSGGSSGGNGGKCGNGASCGDKGSKGGTTKDSSLIDLGLLRPNQDDNVLDLDVSGQDVLGIGIGNKPGGSGGSGCSPGYGGKGCQSKNSKGDSDQSLIDLGLLRPDSKNNIVDLNLAKQDFLGIGLGNS